MPFMCSLCLNVITEWFCFCLVCHDHRLALSVKSFLFNRSNPGVADSSGLPLGNTKAQMTVPSYQPRCFSLSQFIVGSSPEEEEGKSYFLSLLIFPETLIHSHKISIKNQLCLIFKARPFIFIFGYFLSPTQT